MSIRIPGVLYVEPANGAAAPVVLDSPHSGTEYPADFAPIVPMSVVRRSEDTFVDELFVAAPDCGASLQAALFPRIYIDPNRSLSDIDVELLADTWAEPLDPSEKTRLGHGLIWRICPPDQAIYKEKLIAAEVRRRIDTYWRPYHDTLRETLDAAHGRFGAVWHVNCHSMPAGRPPPKGGDLLMIAV